MQANPEKTWHEFWARVAKTETCWNWIGAIRRDGYGEYKPRAGRGVRFNFLAHRLSYELNVGPIPEGLVIDHLCCNRRCVNPGHLRACTAVENVMAPHSQSPSKINAEKTHCPQGHLLPPPGSTPGKSRACRECYMPRLRARYAAKFAHPAPPATHCKHGHEFTPDNTVIWYGRRGCRICRRRRGAEFARKKRARAKEST